MTVNEISEVLNINQYHIVEVLIEKGIFEEEKHMLDGEKNIQKSLIRSLPRIEKIDNVYSSQKYKKKRQIY